MPSIPSLCRHPFCTAILPQDRELGREDAIKALMTSYSETLLQPGSASAQKMGYSYRMGVQTSRVHRDYHMQRLAAQFDRWRATIPLSADSGLHSAS